MINRNIEESLRDFLVNDNRALLVTGARQVGKTFSIRKVGKECYEQFVEINFIEQPQAVEVFKNQQSAEDMLLRLSALTRKQLKPGKTLVFFDEVQQCKEMVTAIKFLVDEGSYRYVMSGSLLGVELEDLRSVPVGYMAQMEMYPLDLVEFFGAIGLGDDMIVYLRDCFDKRHAVDDFVHKRLLEAVRLYLLVGGMPAVVQKYLDTNNLRSVLGEQNGIIATYRRDIAQYSNGSKLQIKEIYDLIPAELNAKNKRFVLKELNEKARFRKFESSFMWLMDAGVAIPTYNLEEPRLPLLLSKQRNLFKLFCNDVGLLAATFGGNIQTRILSNDVNINFGSVYENLVAQELYAHGFAQWQHSLYYFNSKRQGEIDFVVEYDNHVLPIEVKSGKDYDRHNALTGIMGNAEYDIPEAMVFCQNNVLSKGRVIYLPIYMIAFLAPEKSSQGIYTFNLADLK